MANSVAAQIAERLAWTGTPCAPNPFTAAQVREDAREYLGFLDEDAIAHPDALRVPHSNFWMHDGDYRHAFFVVLIFRKGNIEFLHLVGNAYEIRHFLEQEEPDDLDELPGQLVKRFRVEKGSIKFSRKEAEEWLGRSW